MTVLSLAYKIYMFLATTYDKKSIYLHYLNADYCPHFRCPYHNVSNAMPTAFNSCIFYPRNVRNTELNPLFNLQ